MNVRVVKVFAVVFVVTGILALLSFLVIVILPRITLQPGELRPSADEDLRIILYVDGRKQEPVVLAKGTDLHKGISGWASETRGATPSLQSYVPQVYVRGERVSYNFLASKVVIEVYDDPPKQFVAPLGNNGYEIRQRIVSLANAGQ